ncbi:PEP-CTERM sorting domain-containing protein [Rubrivivax gelatinosus]|uniref:PEP-CTERM sorting domain-containing protein n=1 Tax=Rubrivivax gelatinosus TaxID=28068 RepID=UPI001E51009C|nr:PEP-CTERM sorting domain-containing protein [Rubrivivax gelatinosus]
MAAVSVALAGAAQATEIVDFDEFGERVEAVASLVSGPLVFSSDSGYLGVELTAPNVGAFNGTPYLIDSRGTLSVARSDGQAFRLDGFDIGQSWFTTQPTAAITVTYDLAGGGSSSQTLALTRDFQRLTPGIGITALHFALDVPSLGGGYVALDNVAISAVPEPATWASFALGLALLGGAARRRRPS